MLYRKDSLLYAYSIVYLMRIEEELSLNEILSSYSERRQPLHTSLHWTEAKELFGIFSEIFRSESDKGNRSNRPKSQPTQRI